MALSSGTVLKQYEIVEPLGAGAMGEVYRARDTQLGRDVAIKVLPDHLADDAYVRARFEREARAVAALSHPNLLAIHEFTLAADTPFAVMELLEGQTLRQRLARGPLPWRQALEIVQLVADGLAAAHAKGIIHRDLKPDNIFITKLGVVKVLDFGLAAQARVAATRHERPTLAETLPGMVLGTIGYMSPEQLQGMPPDARSDIFSLGCVLYEMLTGRLPFDGSNQQEILASTLRDPAPLLPALEPAPPPELARVVEYCLARPAERRFASARDVALAVEGILKGSGPVQVQPTRKRISRGKSIAVMPFENTSNDPGTEYIADGITESIINMLSQLPGVRVVPRTMVFRYKGIPFDAGATALALNARTLLTGRVVARGDVVSVQAELIDAANQSQIWGEQYRRPASDLVGLQEEIAWQISEAMRMRLTGEQKKRLRKKPTISTAAYEEYLRGLFEFNKWSAEGFRRSLEHFQKAVDLDPEYALAWCALGTSSGALAYYGYVPSIEGFPRAEASAQRALELEPDLPEAHITLGLTRVFFSWDSQEAEKSFKRALELNPSNASAHSYYAFCLQMQGRHRMGEAVREAQIGHSLDPLGSVQNMALGWTLLQSERFEESAAQGRHILAIDPSFAEAHAIITMALEMLGRFDEAARHLPGALRVFGLPFDEAAAAAGDVDPSTSERYWRTKLVMLEEVGRTYRLLPMTFAIAHAALGDLDAAVDVLEPLVPARAGYVAFMRDDPGLKPLRGFPRFEALVRLANVR